ncbi:hypothetical protein Plhal710r2_c006g0027481 [Plasmopara halstedii]
MRKAFKRLEASRPRNRFRTHSVRLVAWTHQVERFFSVMCTTTPLISSFRSTMRVSNPSKFKTIHFIIYSLIIQWIFRIC